MLRKFFVNNWHVLFIILVAVLSSGIFVYRHQRAEIDKLLQETVEADHLEAAIRAEKDRENANTEKSDIDSRNAGIDLSGEPTRTPTDKLINDSAHVTSNGFNAAVPQGTEGQDAGMTDEEMKARRQLRREIDQKWEAYSKKRRVFSQALLKSADDEISIMLSVFKLLSPEQLEQARQEALETLPMEVVDDFLNDLANEGITKAPEQLTREVQQLLASRETFDIVREELNKEFREIQRSLRAYHGAEAYEKMYQERAAQIEKGLEEENKPFLDYIRRYKKD